MAGAVPQMSGMTASALASSCLRRVLQLTAIVGLALFGIVPACGSAVAQQTGTADRGSSGPPLRSLNVGFVRHAVGAWAGKIGDGSFDMATGRTIRWFPHDTDSSLVVALSSGRLDIGLIGVSVAAAAIARGLDLKIFSVICGAADSEGLMLGPTVTLKPGEAKGLAGKVIAVPFGSTPHFRLLESLRRWGGTLSAIRVVNLQTQQIGQAWSRGEVDAVVASRPLLMDLEKREQIMPLVNAGEHSSLLVFAATGEFVQQHTVFLSRFIDVVARADHGHAGRGTAPLEDSSAFTPLSMLTGLTAGTIVSAMDHYRPPTVAEMASNAWLGGGASAGIVAHLKATLDVWRWAGRASGGEPDLVGAVALEPVQMALGYQR